MARRNDHTREDLEKLALKAATDIVKKRGAAALTARTLAHAIGYTPGTLYNVFGSMEGLYFKMNGITLDRIHEAVNGPGANLKKTELKKTLKSMAQAYMEFAYANSALWLMVFDHRFAAAEKAPEWYRQKVKDQFTPLENALSPLFTGKSAREKTIAARVLWSSVHGICLMHMTQKISLVSDDSALSMSDYLIENFVKGLSA